MASGLLEFHADALKGSPDHPAIPDGPRGRPVQDKLPRNDHRIQRSADFKACALRRDVLDDAVRGFAQAVDNGTVFADRHARCPPSLHKRLSTKRILNCAHPKPSHLKCFSLAPPRSGWRCGERKDRRHAAASVAPKGRRQVAELRCRREKRNDGSCGRACDRSIQKLHPELLVQAPDLSAGFSPLSGVGLHGEHEADGQIGFRNQTRAAVREVNDGAGARADVVVLDKPGAAEANAR